MSIDRRAFAEFIVTSLDGTYGPEDEGYIDGWDKDGEFFLEYTDDETQTEQTFRLTLEPLL